MKLALLVLWVATAAAEPKPAKPQQPPDIANTFGFDAAQIKTSKCRPVVGALLKKLETSYRCAWPPPVPTLSGKPRAAVCIANRGKSEYDLFRTAADCAAERDALLASPPD